MKALVGCLIIVLVLALDLNSAAAQRGSSCTGNYNHCMDRCYMLKGGADVRGPGNCPSLC
jgi:hypothetical protein